MYSLFVTFQATEQSEGAFDIERNRFLEYTEEHITTQLVSLSNEARECIQSWPCLLMQEGRGQEEAYVVEITRVDTSASEVKTTIRHAPPRSPETRQPGSRWWSRRAPGAGRR